MVPPQDDDHNIADWAHLYEARAFQDEPMDDAEEMDEAGENAAKDQPPDELGQVLVDSQRDSETLKESSSEEILSIHDVPTKASINVRLQLLDYQIMGEEE